MKKIFFILIALTFSNVFSQSGWVRNEAPTMFIRIYFINSMTGFGASAFTPYKTSNGGVNWIPMNSKNFVNNYPHEIFFLNLDTGFVIYGGSLYRTINGGSNWIVLSMQHFEANGLQFINSQTGFCCGYGGVIKTTNAGVNWNNSLQLKNRFLSKLSFTGINTGYACGEILNNGVIFKTTNSGENWTQLQVNINTEFILDIKFANENTGFVSGEYNNQLMLLKTTDGGISWERKGTDIQDTYRQFISVPDTNTIYTVGNGKMYKSTNGGDNFSVIYQSSQLNGHYFLNTNTGFVSGYDSSWHLAKTTNGGVGIQNIGTAIPDKFYLEQNYPNPFNPNTNIEFSLPQKTFVKLKVFDLLGREIANLVNENLSAGKYNYDFTALSLPSGIYFYKLETENFSETKKMVLVK